MGFEPTTLGSTVGMPLAVPNVFKRMAKRETA